MNGVNSITVLVVDDELSIGEVISMNFELEGFKVLKADGGFSALEIIKNQNIDFVVSDIRMSNGDGFFLLKEVVKFNPYLPVLLITGFTEISREEILKAGALDVFHKPFEMEKIIALIKETVNSN